MSPPAVVAELVARFERNLDAYRSGQYNETQVRREFLDPFFKALGWDIDNERYRINVFDWPAEFPQVFRRAEAAAELREPAAVPPLDYTLPGVPLHGRYAKATPRARRPAKAAVPAPSAPDWEGGFDVVIAKSSPKTSFRYRASARFPPPIGPVTADATLSAIRLLGEGSRA